MEDARIGRTLDGRYRIEKRLAAGGMGIVYRAERIGLAKKVAVKFLHRSQATVSDRRQRFEREAAAMSRLSHPNLVSIIDYGELDDAPYLVMEYHKGESLRQALERGALDPRRAVHIARQLLAGLDSAHASGVVHRDLKPENVLIVGKPGEDLIKVLDFGVAKLLEGDGRPTELSVAAGSLLGTAEYMAPEQVRCEVIDPRADLYAVGILLYEMLTGRRPFEAERDLAVLRMQLEVAPQPPRELVPGISPQLERVVLRALDKERERRWPSADDMASALDDTPEGQTRPPRPPSTPEARGEPRRRRRWPWLVALLLLLSGTVAGLWIAQAQGYIDLPLPPWLARAVGLEAPPDAMPPDAMPPDAMPPDAMPIDAMPVDAGAPDDAPSSDAGGDAAP